MHICLLGMTGSGKTTVASLLAERLNVPAISSGDIARGLAHDDPHTFIALEKGKMAPENAMRAAVRQRLEESDVRSGGWVLEGFPRSVAQLVCLMDWTAALPVFVHIDVTEWAVIERLTSRRRDDDTPDAIERRIADFHANVVPVLAVLESGGVLRTTDRDMPPATIVEYVEGIVA
jgi:adenylate kinase